MVCTACGVAPRRRIVHALVLHCGRPGAHAMPRPVHCWQRRAGPTPPTIRQRRALFQGTLAGGIECEVGADDHARGRGCGHHALVEGGHLPDADAQRGERAVYALGCRRAAARGTQPRGLRCVAPRTGAAARATAGRACGWSVQQAGEAAAGWVGFGGGGGRSVRCLRGCSATDRMRAAGLAEVPTPGRPAGMPVRAGGGTPPAWWACPCWAATHLGGSPPACEPSSCPVGGWLTGLQPAPACQRRRRPVSPLARS
jgi:hypothetical protein